MRKRNGTKSLSVLFAIILLALTTTAAFAAMPQDLHIEALEFIGTSGETFNASGGAVDTGLVCPTGTVDDLNVAASGTGMGGVITLHVLKRFDCADASGTFDVQMVVRLNLTTHETTARWFFADGTGAYAGLNGNGSLAGTPIVPGFSILDVYDGMVY